MRLVDIIPDADTLCSYEAEDLGLRMLPALAFWRQQYPSNTLTRDDLIHVVVGDPSRGVHGQYPLRDSARVEEAIREAWAWLEGSALLIQDRRYRDQVRSLSRKAQRLAQEPDPRRVFSARRIAKEMLHPTIREDVSSQYHRGKYDTAVFEAMKAVEVSVRDAAHLPAALLGVKLMRAAFAPSPNAGPLTDTSAEGGEQVARMEFFAGAIGSYKNPHSHRYVALDDPDEAAEIILLANHLLRIVDSRRADATRP